MIYKKDNKGIIMKELLENQSVVLCISTPKVFDNLPSNQTALKELIEVNPYAIRFYNKNGTHINYVDGTNNDDIIVIEYDVNYKNKTPHEQLKKEFLKNKCINIFDTYIHYIGDEGKLPVHNTVISIVSNNKNSSIIKMYPTTTDFSNGTIYVSFKIVEIIKSKDNDDVNKLIKLFRKIFN